MDRIYILCFIVLTTINISLASEINCTNNINNATGNIEWSTSSKILSRRKRFLVFPDGSSFQLVFCTQNHGYLQIGNIVWFGNTAALAWELPTDPEIFSMFRDKKRVYANRRQDSSKYIFYLDKDGMVVGKKPYRRYAMVNPAFAKRSIIGDAPKENAKKKTLSIKEMHEKEKNRNHFQGLEANAIEFHRNSRMDLYGKVEKLLEGLGWNGRQCVLRLLCETGKTRSGQGTLLEEILRVTFTLPGSRQFDSVEEYDVAHGTDEECAQTYSDCGIFPLPM